MSFSDYLTGLAFFGGMLGSIGLASWLILRRKLPALQGLTAAVGYGLIGCCGLVSVHLIPGALGILSREAVLGTSLLGLLFVSRLKPIADLSPDPQWPSPPGDTTASRVIAATGVFVVSVFALALLSQIARISINYVDATSFTLPNIVHWIQGNTFWQQNEFNPLFPLGTYPNNGDIAFLAVMLPWKNDAFVRVVNLPLLALTGLAVAALASELRAPRSTAALVGAATVAIPAVGGPALLTVKPDIFMLAAFASGLVFLVRHARTQRTSDLVMAGLGLGLAFGSRWYGITAVPIVLAIWVLGNLLARRPLERIVRQALALSGLVFLAGGFWLLRNWVETGNPFFPAKFGVLGITIFDAPRNILLDAYGFTVAGYLDNSHVLFDLIVPRWWESLAAPGIAALVGLVIAGIVLVRSRKAHDPTRVLVIGGIASAIALAVMYAALPASAQGILNRPQDGIVANSRWLMPALIPAAAVAAWAIGRAGRWRVPLELCVLIAIVQGAREAFNPGPTRTALIGAGLLTLAVVVFAVRRRPSLVDTLKRPALAGGFAATVLAVVVLGGQISQTRFNEHRYEGLDPTSDWLLTHAQTGYRIGAAGYSRTDISPLYSLFGPRFGNEVDYVGRMVHHYLLRYQDRDEFVQALHRGRFQFLFIGRGAPPRPGIREERWARSAGYVMIVRSHRFFLLGRPRAVTRAISYKDSYRSRIEDQS